MKLKVEFRSAETGDAEMLAKLGRETFYGAFANHPLMPKTALELYLKKAFSVSQIATELNDPQAAFLLAEIGDQAIGYAKLVAGDHNSNVDAENPVKLQRLYARQEFIGAGVGAGLLSLCLEEAKRGGRDNIWLTVWKHNQRAQNFYRKWGFESCGSIDFQFGGTMLTDILMQKRL